MRILAGSVTYLAVGFKRPTRQSRAHIRDNLPRQLLDRFQNPVFPTNHLPGTSKPSLSTTKLQHRKPKQQLQRKFKLLTYTTQPNEFKAWFRCILYHLARKWISLFYRCQGPTQGQMNPVLEKTNSRKLNFFC